jgi:hypothetical protein
MFHLRRVLTYCALILCGVAWLGYTGSDAGAHPVAAEQTSKAEPSSSDPSRNWAPSPDYTAPCWAGGAPGASNTAACHTAELAAINRQHTREHIATITLPRNFWALQPALQTFVITNSERVSRGLHPMLGTTAQLDQWATTAAQTNSDPSLRVWVLRGGTHLHTFGSIWGENLNALDADFIWMYDDGWSATGTANADCTSARAPGCWSHRHVILGAYAGSRQLVAGVATIAHRDAHGALNSTTQVFADYTATTPPLIYTWASARAAGAR